MGAFFYGAECQMLDARCLTLFLSELRRTTRE